MSNNNYTLDIFAKVFELNMSTKILVIYNSYMCLLSFSEIKQAVKKMRRIMGWKKQSDEPPQEEIQDYF